MSRVEVEQEGGPARVKRDEVPTATSSDRQCSYGTAQDSPRRPCLKLS